MCCRPCLSDAALVAVGDKSADCSRQVLAPAQTMACIPGLQWGMDSSTVEERLDVSLETARSLDADSSVVYRISSFSDQGLEQLVYSLPSDSMTEALAGLRAR